MLNFKVFNPSNISPAEKAPLFILHGLMGSMNNWRTQAKQLSLSRTVYTLDLRNHGNSPHISGMSYREMYEDVLEVAQHENITKFHLLGHSMGGKVAMQLALSSNSSYIKSLIIVDIAPKPYPLWHQKTLQGVLSVPLETLKTRQQVDEYLKPWIDSPIERTFMLKNLKRVKHSDHFEWQCNLKAISKGYLKIAGFISTLDQYTNNTLFIRGADSNYILENDTALIYSLFPKAIINTIENSDHLPHIQQPDIFNQLITEFLS